MEKEQFDEFLGGSVQLPRDVQIVRLTAARASEIAAMTYSIENPQQSKLVFQKLPVHMRRRVMSHNANRMPRRLREAHLRQMTKSGLPPKTKRPSRKYRRRPQNLLQEYNRRQRRFIWLETHIWHAKRFHMIEKWGYKIADFPNDKSFRACYRATAQHCLVQDISYYTCLEISGPAALLKETLKRHCNSKELTFGANIYWKGSREGSLMFFKKDSYPQEAIGNVNFLWKPGGSELRTLWIWVHPLIYKGFFKEIVASFEFNEDPEHEFVDKVMQEKSSYRYSNHKGCSMTNLRDSLNRFRLTGPLALAILTDALRVPNLNAGSTTNREEIDSAANSREVDGSGDNSAMDVDGAGGEWEESFYKIPENLEAFRVQKELMDALRTLKSPNQLPPNSVMAATVLDPRFFLPHKRTKRVANGEYYVKIPMPATLANLSPLLDSEVRKLVKAGCKSSQDINKLRSENLVPGVSDDDKFDESVMSKVPVMFIQNPGCNALQKSIGFTSGIDVIIPAGWSMPFWQSFVYRCARPGGLRESRSIALEKLDLNSPETHQPDIPSYADEALSAMTELRAKYFRYPPNRRVNFTKFAITSPFYCEWKILMREWTNSEVFHVLRDRTLLESLQKALSSRSHRQGKNKNINGKKIVVGRSDPAFDKAPFENRNCLVPVKISLEGKGRPKNFALICVPRTNDLETQTAKPKWSGPVQKFQSDPNESERKKLRKNQKVQLKRSNRRGYRCRKLARETAELMQLQKRSGKSAKVLVDRNFALKKEYREKMEDLYLPKCTTVRKSCDREVMGYVTRGDFSFSEARGIGMGYVVLESLLNFLDTQNNIVLVRNTQSRQYRLARIEILNQYR